MKNLEQSATNNLKISPNLDEFVKKELVPGLNISSDYFWKTFEDIVERFSERNRELLNEEEKIFKTRLMIGIFKIKILIQKNIKTS